MAGIKIDTAISLKIFQCVVKAFMGYYCNKINTVFQMHIFYSKKKLKIENKHV